jgi:hypothetical protein
MVAASCLPARAQNGGTTPLAQLQFDIVGVRLVVDPPALTVPKNIATQINTSLTLPPGTGPETREAIESLTNGALIEAELRGPEISPTRIVTRPGQPIPIPPLAVAGDYFLDGVRLVKNGQTILDATASDGRLATTIPIRVINEVFVTNVTSRPLSLDEIRGRGIVIDETNFQAVNFQVAFNIDGAPFTIDVPAALPTPEFLQTRPDRKTLIRQITTLNLSLRGPESQLPPQFDRPGLNFSIAALPFFPVEEEGGVPTLDIPPITGLVVIPGNVAFLNQFFSVLLMVTNVAPAGTPLELREPRARIVLPSGLDRVAGSFEQPGDDPLRLARIDGVGVQPEVAVVQRGPDGNLGTADDIAFIPPQHSAEGEFLVEGLKEGAHLFDLEINATLFGLPSGPVRLQGQAAGAVFVRNPTFAVTLAHPRTIRAGEQYDLYATVTNTSQSPANLVRVNLEPLGISGAQLLTDPMVEFETIAPGQAVTARFRLLSQRTGEVTFSSFTGEAAGGIRLTTGVDERGAPLAPNAIVLPASAAHLPSSLVVAAQRVLGQAFSIATAPAQALPEGVLFVKRQTVIDRAIDLALAGERVSYGEPLGRPLQDLLLDWLGNTQADDGFDQILRTTEAGAAFLAEMAAAMQPDVDLPLDYQRAFAAATVARAPHLSAVAGVNGIASPLLSVSRTLGGAVGESPGGSARSLVSGASLLLTDASIAAKLVVAGVTAPDRYTIRMVARAAGPHDLGVVVPGASPGTRSQLRFAGVALDAGGVVRLDVDLSASGSLLLQVDRNGDGTVDEQLAPVGEVVVEQPPAFVSARQLASSFREGPGNLSDPATYGVLVAVLFDKPVTEETAELRTNYAIEANAVSGAQLQASGRLVYLYLQRPIGGLVPRNLTVSGVADARGHVLPPTTRPIVMTLTDGARVFGQTREAGGGGVPGSVLKLTVADPPFSFDVSTIRSDANGSFDFDFVPRIGNVVLTAQHPTTRDLATVTARIRGQGEQLLLNPTFAGLGTVRGRVLTSDGVTPVPGASVALLPGSVVGLRGFETRSNEIGEFFFADAPVGVFTLSASDSRGQFGKTTGVLASASQTTVLDVVLVTEPDNTGRLVGRVFQSDGATPGVGFDVYVGTFDRSSGRLQAIDRTSTDASGSFSFSRRLPPGGNDVVAFDPATQQLGVVRAGIVALQTTSVSIVLEAVGIVEGVVFNARGEPQPGAIVAGGIALVEADANGFFRIEGVPAGARTIQAGDPVTKRRGDARVVVLPGQTVSVAITLEARATITGRVLDANGNPVPGATVRMPVVGGYTFVFANNAGVYTFPDIELGEHLIQAPGPSKESLISFMETNGLDPSTAFTSGDIPPGAGGAPAPSFGDANAVLAAYQQAVQTFLRVDENLLSGLPMADLGGFGWTKVNLFQDATTVVSDVRFLPVGSVSGRTEDSAGNPIGALTRITTLGVSRTGFPTIVELHRTTTDAASGLFSFGRVPRFDLATFQTAGVRGGDFAIESAHPFSPVIASFRSQLNTTNPNLTGVVVRFPGAAETNGTISGRVFMADNVTPAPVNTQVAIGFGDLTVLTDADGRFQSFIPIPAGRYTVNALSPAGLRGETIALVPAGGTVDVTIRLLGLGSATIVARRATGEPVAGATVAVDRGSFPRERLAGTTDGAGQLHLVNITEGAFSVTIQEPVTGLTGRSASTIVRDADVTVPVVLGASGRVTGRFLAADGMTTIPFAQISLTVGSVRAFATTAADGTFELRSIPIGRFSIEANDPLSGRLGRASDELRFEGHMVDVTVLQVPRGIVTGVVVHADGTTPVQAANVQLESTSVVPTRLQATARLDGSFRFEGIPAGDFQLRAVDPISGFSGDVSGRVIRESEIVDSVVALAPFGAARITVRDHAGQIASNASITVSRGDHFARTAAVDANGSFTFDFLAIGTYQLLARSLADPGNGGEGTVVVSATATAEREIIFRGSGSAAITVVEADGATPVPSAHVRLNARAAPQNGAASALATTLDGFTDATGRVTFQNVPVGEYFASADAGPLAGVGAGSVASPGHAAATTVQLGASATIAGRVLLPDGATPAARSIVTLRFTSQTSQSSVLQVTTGLAGTFEFTGIPLGAFTVSAFELISNGVRTIAGTLGTNGQQFDVGDVTLDNAGPRVTGINPADRATGVAVQPPIVLTFSEPMQPATFSPGQNISLLDGTTNIPLQALAFSADNRSVTLRPVQPLRSSALYSLILRGAPNGPRDQGADLPMVDPFVATFITQDVIPPVLVSSSPSAGDRQVLLESGVRVSFSEPVATATLVVHDSTGAVQAGQMAFTAGNTAVAFVPAAFLRANTTYTVLLTNVADVAGNALPGGNVSFSFTTLDTLPPAITAIAVAGIPRPLASLLLTPTIAGTDTLRVEYLIGSTASVVSTAAPFSANLVVPNGVQSFVVAATAFDQAGNRSSAFTRSIDVTPNAAPTITLHSVSGATFAAQGQTLEFEATAADDDRLLSVALSAVGAAPFSEVRPVPAGAATFTTRFSIQVPAAAASNGTVTVQAAATDVVGTQSSPAVLSLPVRDGISPILNVNSPFNNARIVPGQPLGVLFDASDDVGVASVSVTCNPSLAGCETRTLTPALNNTHQTFTLAVPAELEAPATIVLVIRATDAAGNISQVARTLIVPDTTPPVLAALEPVAGSTRVVAGQSVQIRANVTDNVGVTTVLLQTEGALVTTETVPVTPPIVSGAAIFSIMVPATVPNGSTITVRARARDQANNLSTELSLLLTIGDIAAPSLTILSPAEGAPFAPGQTATLSVRATDDTVVQRIVFNATGVFSSTLTTDITPPAASVDRTFPLSLPATTAAGTLTLTAEAFDAAGNSSGVVARNVTVTDTIAPQVHIASPAGGASIDPRSPLAVSVEAADQVGVIEIAFNAAGATSAAEVRPVTPSATNRIESFSVTFATPPAAGGTLTLAASARDAANNVGSAAPVVVSVLDVVAPDVAGVTPAHGATAVDPQTAIVVEFSEPMDRATLNASTLALSQGGTPVPTAIAFTTDDRIATLTPVTQPLALNTAFTLTVGAGARDRAGNAVPSVRTFTFTTTSPDLVGPRVLTIDPANGAVNVALTAPVTVAFNEPVDPATVTAQSFRVTIGGSPVSGTLSLSGGTTARFTPTDAWPTETVVTIELSSTIHDLFGNALTAPDGSALTAPLTFTFLSGSFSITNPPRGQLVVENTSLLIEARASAGLGVASVLFTVNGQAQPVDSSSPFNISFTVPSAAASATLTIVASARNSVGTQIASDTLVADVAVALQVSPSLAGVPIGQTTPLRFSISSALPDDLTIQLNAANPSLVNFAVNPVTLPAGQLAVNAAVAGVSAGATTIIATSTHGTAATIVSVSSVVAGSTLMPLATPVGFAIANPPSAGFIVTSPGQTATTGIQVLASTATAATAVSVTSSDPAVATASGTTVAAGQQSSQIEIVTGVAGVATLIIRAGSEVRSLTVFVGAPPAGSTPILVAPPVGFAIANPPSVGFIVVPIAQTTTTRVLVLATAAAAATPVSVTSTNPAVASGSAANVAAGEQSADVSITPGQPGAATLIIRAGSDVRSLTVYVGAPPAGSTPLLLAPPVGTAVSALPFIGRALIAPGVTRTIGVRLLDAPAVSATSFTVISSNPAVASVISPVIVQAGDRVAELQITTGVAGSARLTLEGAGIRFEFTVDAGTTPSPTSTPVITAPPIGVTVIADPGIGRVSVSPAAPVAPQLGIRLLAAPAAGDVQVVVRSSNTAIVTVGGGETASLTIPAGDVVLNTSIATTGTAGAAILTFEFQGERRQMTVIVGNPPLNQIPPVTAPIVGVEVRP